MKVLFLILSLCICHVGLSQHGDNWPIGLFSGIKFTSSGPVKITTKIEYDTGAQSNSWAPRSVSFSDCNGELVAYGSSNQMWNKFGFTISGAYWRSYNKNAIQFGDLPTLTIPKPNSTRYLYYFAQYETNSGDTLFYYIIDLHANNGYGSVVSRNYLSNHITNNLHYALHANGKDIWILQGYDDKTLNSYLLTDTGINRTPVISNNVYSGHKKYPFANSFPYVNPPSPYRNPNFQTNFKVNNARTRLISTSIDTCTTKLGCVWEYEFDNKTGIAKNGKPIFRFDEIPKFTASGNIHRLEISTNDSFYYLMTFGVNSSSQPKYTNRIYQYNVNSGNKIQVFAQKERYTNMQLGPDGKIYFLSWQYPFAELYTIAHPNRLGLSCNIRKIMEDSSFFGTNMLPTVYQPYRPLFFYSNLEKSPCQDTASFEMHIDTNFRKLIVYFGDGDSLLLQKPLKSIYNIKHKYVINGEYFVQLKAMTPDCDHYSFAGDTFKYYEIPRRFSINKKSYPTCTGSTVELIDSFYNAKKVIYKWGNLADTNFIDSLYSIVKVIKTIENHQIHRTNWSITIGNENCPNYENWSDSIELSRYPNDSVAYHLTGFDKKTNYNSKFVFEGCEPLMLQFSDTGGKVSKGLINWANQTFQFYKDQKITNKFINGLYMAVVADTNIYGCSNIDTFYVRAWQKPRSQFEISTLKGCLKNTTFRVKNISEVISDSVSYTLYMDSTGINFPLYTTLEKKYSRSGVYYVKLLAQSDKLCNDQKDTIIDVYDHSKAEFTINDTIQCIKSNLFELNSQNTDYGSNHWSVANVLDTIVYNNNFIRFSVSDTGAYKVRNIRKNSNNCEDTFYRTIKITSSPKVNFDVNDTSQCLNENLFIMNITSIPYDLKHQVLWGDNTIDSFSGNKQLAHQYNSIPNIETIKTIELKASIGNCHDTIKKQIILYPNSETNIDIRGFCYGDSTYMSFKTKKPSFNHSEHVEY